MTKKAIAADVQQALSKVYDPCSVAAGRPLSLLDMGLVRGWDVDEAGALHVTLCVTFAGCTMAPHFAQAAEAELRAIPGVRDVRIAIDTAHVWSPEEMRAPPPTMSGAPQAWRTRAPQSEKNASQAS